MKVMPLTLIYQKGIHWFLQDKKNPKVNYFGIFVSIIFTFNHS